MLCWVQLVKIALCKNQAEREHALSFLSSVPDEMFFFFCKISCKRNFYCKYTGEIPFCKCHFAMSAEKNNLLCQADQIECQFCKDSMFVNKVQWNVSLQKQAQKEKSLSRMPGEIPFVKQIFTRTEKKN